MSKNNSFWLQALVGTLPAACQPNIAFVVVLFGMWILGVGNACAVEDRASNQAVIPNAPTSKCQCVRVGDSIELASPSFVYRLNSADGLKGISWENRRTNKRISLGTGAEFELDLDASQRRIFITGWKVSFWGGENSQPDEETGYKRGVASAEFDDSSWPGRAVPPSYGSKESPLYSDYYWARTHVFLPRDAESQELSLVLGGFGLFDFRYLRIFVNGHEVGSRLVEKRWTEPGVFDLGLRSKVRSYLRFGNDNIIAVQACGYRCRTAQLDAVDPQEYLSLALRYYWPGQFEQYLVVGKPLTTPKFRVTDVNVEEQPDGCEARLELASDQPKLAAKVTYRWNATEQVLHKFVEVRNNGAEPVRLMDVRLGTYATSVSTSEGEQGFPVYIDGQFFASLAHPAGWATGQDGEVRLRQYPGKKLDAGEKFSCMETVLGVAEAGAARKEFVAYVGSRMRRVLRGHDKSYSIFDSFGAWPNGDWWGQTEEYAINQIQEIIEPEVKEAGCVFDFYVMELWRDIKGDLEHPNPANFPNGFKNVIAELKKQKIRYALWITTSLASWSIGENPVIGPNITYDPAYGCEEGLSWLCLATDPLKTMLSTAHINQIRNNGLRLVKFDGTSSICYNPNHNHLPGIYSTEAIDNAFIQIMKELDAANPELFIMLYWGPRSPWWLLHGDTLFEPGLAIEAAHPCSSPTPYVRDSVTLGLDQAQWYCADVPTLGKDSLGIWLSHWGWNSGIGKERWQEGFVMDMGRGSLLAQPWSDNGTLSKVERRQLADFIHLLKERPDCFKNSRPILGDPWKNEPYGYCCTDGHRAFLAINNCTWQNRSLPMELNSVWGLPDGQTWSLYRWYPEQSQLIGDTESFGPKAAITLRPFEVVLLEAIPAGQKPSLDREFSAQKLPSVFAESSREVVVTTRPAAEASSAKIWNVLEPTIVVSRAGATLTRQPDGSVLASGTNTIPETYTITADTQLTGITGIRLEALSDAQLPGRGPGRARNGNFALSEFQATIKPQGSKASSESVALQKPTASYSQNDYGNWPIDAVLDKQVETGWSIFPYGGMSHTAVFETRTAVGFAGGSTLTFGLDQSGPAEHTLGRFRLSVTTAKPPFQPSMPMGLRRWDIQCQAPVTKLGGLLLVTAELTKAGKSLASGGSGLRISEVKLARRPVECQPVLGSLTFPTCWQAWRIALEPSAAPQPVELTVIGWLSADVECAFQGHFVPH
jgi:hypothetical protein